MTEQVSISASNGRKIKTNGKLLGACFNKKLIGICCVQRKMVNLFFSDIFDAEIEAHLKYLKF